MRATLALGACAVGASAVLGAASAFGWFPEGVVVADSADFGFSYGRGSWARDAAAEAGDLCI